MFSSHLTRRTVELATWLADAGVCGMLEPERTSGSKVSHWFIELHPSQHACMLCILTSSLAHIRACDYLVSPSSYRADRSVGARYGIPKDWRAWLHVESTPARSISEWTATPSVVASVKSPLCPTLTTPPRKNSLRTLRQTTRGSTFSGMPLVTNYSESASTKRTGHSKQRPWYARPRPQKPCLSTWNKGIKTSRCGRLRGMNR